MKIIVPFSALILFVATSRIRAEVYAYTSLHIFSAKSVTSPNTNADGSTPSPGLTLADTTLYGMANSGGISNFGTIFKLNTDGSEFTTIYNFTNGADGKNPSGSEALVFSSNALFGVTAFGGTNIPRRGSVFRINADGSGFTNLYSFHGSDGQSPAAGLIISGSTLYGTTHNGGGSGKQGTIFKIDTDGSGFAMLFAFSGTNGGSPSAPLILSGNTLYGTTLNGSNGAGSIFRVDTDGNNFTNLYSFTAAGLDGELPESALTLAGNSLFGTATAGGISNYGTVFRINTDGSGFTVLHGFTSTWDAGGPFGGLVSIGNLLYGTALAGSSSSSNYGTVYQINTDGSGFTNVYNFTGGADGAGPIRTLALSGNTFYGATAAGGVAFGTNGNGTIFALTLPVSLSILRSNANNILSWPSPSTGFVLQTNADLVATNWGNYGAAVSDGTNQSVIVPSSSGSLFFRLSHP